MKILAYRENRIIDLTKKNRIIGNGKMRPHAIIDAIL